MKTDWKKTNQPVFLIWNTEVKSKFFWVLVIIISITQGTFISFLWNIDNKNTMWVTYIIEIFLVATLKNKKTSKIASNNIFYSKATSFVQSQLTGKDPEAGKDWRQEEKGMTEDGLLDGITRYWMRLSKFWETMNDREAWHAAVPGVTKSWTWLNNWTTTKQDPPGTDLCPLCPLLCLTYRKGLVSHVSPLSQKASLRINERELPVQDGGVEGHALISFCERTKITTSCWTIINRRMLEPTKKRYPMSKDKEATARW